MTQGIATHTAQAGAHKKPRTNEKYINYFINLTISTLYNNYYKIMLDKLLNTTYCSNCMQPKGDSMQKNKPKQMEHFNPEQLVAWEKYRSGLPQTKIAKSIGVHQATVSRWVKNIQDYMKQCPQYQEALPRIASLVPHALNVYEYNIKRLASLQASKDVLKMAGLFIEYVKTEDVSEKSRLSEAELRAKIKDLAGQDNDKLDSITGQNGKDTPYLTNKADNSENEE